jgi:orotidine-5'-phosphate decarboxylase
MLHVASSELQEAARTVPEVMSNRLVLALDVADVGTARAIVDELEDTVSFFKIGMWLFFKKETDRLIDDLVAREKQVFLDYKMYDIGETVKRGVAGAATRGVSIVTVHGDDAIMKAALEGKGNSELKVFAITVLTSLDDAALQDMGYRLSAEELVKLRVQRAVACGCDGVIASAHDDPDALRGLAEGGERLLIATPGVRRATDRTNDHRRFADPATAIRKGADYLVVGRPILEAADRAAEARNIIAEMERGWAERLAEPG